MGKKKKFEVPKETKIFRSKNVDAAVLRCKYLFNLSVWMREEAQDETNEKQRKLFEEYSRSLNKDLKFIQEKRVYRMTSPTKRLFCKKCSELLIGSSSKIRIKKKRLSIRCRHCGNLQKNFELNDNQKKKSIFDSIEEMKINK
ncbi:hypothetical protein SNEBB_001366 [Seison nebaliae]|nr:hypothetical protein SNEBB_001366 [Seison nebaliae]